MTDGAHEQSHDGSQPIQGTSNRKVVLSCLAALAFMGSLTAASPALYRLFCQVTGYGGTTQRADKPSSVVLDKVITVRFDANTSSTLHGWVFEPVQSTLDVKVGETAIAFYRATNTTDHELKGTAAFNVAPEQAGLYFNKIECFCFTEQVLKPGQSVEMPVTFFVDPKIVEDRDTRTLANLTLSYVFYPLEKTAGTTVAPASGAAATPAPAPGNGG